METTPRIAILGAGPTGLEAALAAADAGYPFRLFDAADEVSGYIRSWGHVQLFTPWDLDVSPRMRRHLEGAGVAVPTGAACPTGAELIDRLLAPVSRLPEVAPHLRLGTRVVQVSRQGLLKNDEIGTPGRAEPPFRLLLADTDGREWIETADIVLDCTGSWGHPNPIGDGGIPAPGERDLADHISHAIPDLPQEADEWAGREILLIGAGHSAETAARDLAALAEDRAGTHIFWALRSPEPSFEPIADDPLPERSQLMAAAGRLARGASPHLTPIPGVVVESLQREPDDESTDGRVVVTLRHRDGRLQQVTVDRIVAMTGAVGDATLYRQLQVHECWATSGPMKLAATLLASTSTDCLTQTSAGADTLKNPEPDFFLLGSKSYGRNTTFLMRVGWQQVDEVFELLGQAR